MWHWGPAVTVAKVVREHLVLGEPGEGRGARFERVGPDEWVGLDGYYTGEPLRIIRRGDGRISHLDLARSASPGRPYDPRRRRPRRRRRGGLALGADDEEGCHGAGDHGVDAVEEQLRPRSNSSA